MNIETVANYRSQVEELRNTAYSNKNANKKGDVALRGIMSASLFNLMPTIDVEQHEDVMDKISFFQRWAVKDQKHIELIEQLVFEGPQPDFGAFHTAPTIFCSYHVGSYRLLIPYLIRQGLSITMLIDSAVALQQSDDFRAVVNCADPEAIAEGRFEILDTAKSNLMIAMMRTLRRGRCLIVFIDGNSSVNGNEADPGNMVPLQFLGQTMYARKGVAFLSHLTGASVTPVMLYRAGDGYWENRMRWHSPIHPGDQERGSYVRSTIVKLYHILEESMPPVFEQWESWRYVEKSLAVCNAGTVKTIPSSTQAIPIDASLQLNKRRYAKYQLDEEQYLLFDRSSYRSLFITADFSAFLDGFVSPQTVECSLAHPSMTPGALKSMLSKEILIFSDTCEEMPT